MTIETSEGSAVLQTVQEAIQHHGNTVDELIPILNEVNSKIGYLPKSALDEVSRQLKTPKSQVFSVASFYSMLSTKPRGRHVIQFCESAPCHVAGGRQVWETLKEALHLQPGETSPDGKWTLLTTSCLGVCGVGPVMTIDEEIFGNLQPDQIPGILARY